MNRRQAKQEACRAAARMVDSFLVHPLAKGDRDYEGESMFEWTETDWLRFQRAAVDLRNDLIRRAGDHPPAR